MYQPVVEVTRGSIVESQHFGAAAVVDSGGRLLASVGDPYLVTYLRSSAKPFQALPFIERGGDQMFHLTSKEIAILCSSHDGSHEHVSVIKGIQEKVGVQESDLLCGAHLPFHWPTQLELLRRGEPPSPNHNNCSGKHTGMLAHARLRGLPISDYINPEHPIQQTILQVISEMTSLPADKIAMGIDGCSAPTFALPLYHAALGFARLCDPRGLSLERAAACRRIVSSMLAHPVMVGGEGRFDTRLMEVGAGRILAKVGAEGYLCIGVLPGALGADSPGVGIALKIADGDISLRKANGDSYNRARPSFALEILRQMGYLSKTELEALADFGPVKPLTNVRKLIVGQIRPAFTLNRGEESP
ncbi:MAG: asparaginase [Anaerolineales bacterium]|nr:asparaginase [Anaerolineales bacterium]MCX7609873.1 asparaginase [Anaerolineales bacterium]MDW8227161.1 asparaginase [Anaerolineales bacterium]MDW8447012.1 asparaginase [Anaerolineales bacterium]